MLGRLLPAAFERVADEVVDWVLNDLMAANLSRYVAGVVPSFRSFQFRRAIVRLWRVACRVTVGSPLSCYAACVLASVTIYVHALQQNATCSGVHQQCRLFAYAPAGASR